MLAEVAAERHSGLYIEDPHLMVPQRMVDGQSGIEVISTPVFPPQDVLPEEVREPFIPVPIDEIKYLLPVHEENPVTIFESSVTQTNLEDETGIEISQSGIVLATDIDAALLRPEAENTSRAVRRLFRYEMIAALYDKYKALESDSVIFVVKNQGSTTVPIETVRKILESWYDNELFHEPLTRTVASGRNEARLPQPDLAVEAANKLVRDHSYKEKALLDKVHRFINLRKHTGTNVQADATPLRESTEEEIKAEKEQIQREQEKKTQDRAREKDGVYKDVQDGHQNLMKGKSLVWDEVYDPDLDEPSEEAAAFMRELWERPF